MQEIAIAAISAGFPTIATIITALTQAKATRRNAAKQSILQMILEDRMDYRDGKLPTNYQAIMHEFDIYTKAGGNSYVAEKVGDYKDWIRAIEQKTRDNRDEDC
jgi:hypothetical protein